MLLIWFSSAIILSGNGAALTDIGDIAAPQSNVFHAPIQSVQAQETPQVQFNLVYTGVACQGVQVQEQLRPIMKMPECKDACISNDQCNFYKFSNKKRNPTDRGFDCQLWNLCEPKESTLPVDLKSKVWEKISSSEAKAEARMEIPTGVLSNPGMLCPVTNEPLKDDPAGVYVLKEDLERIQLGLHNRPIYAISSSGMYRVINQHGMPFPDPFKRTDSKGNARQLTLKDFELVQLIGGPSIQNQVAHAVSHPGFTSNSDWNHVFILLASVLAIIIWISIFYSKYDQHELEGAYYSIPDVA